jgi:hypothetical protein
VWYLKGHYPSPLQEADQKDFKNLHAWEEELANLEKKEEEEDEG